MERTAISEADRAAVADRAPEIAASLEAEIAKAVVGQRDVVRQVLLTLFVGGHALVRGVPGLAKTLLIKSLASALDLSFNRIQFTPDLMPGDIIVGDADGLVAVPQGDAERVLASAKAILEKETAAMKQILAGTVDRSWVDKTLKEKGYRI